MSLYLTLLGKTANFKLRNVLKTLPWDIYLIEYLVYHLQIKHEKKH